MTLVANPVLPGCYPDPSVCRVGDDYYLATSTFEYFPAIPIFRSRDLANWEQLGHAIERPDQVDLATVPSSGGLFAPTIRHHDGTWYLVCTLVHGEGRRGNFLLTARDPAGPWSDPIWLDAPGIDPSLFFDEGRAWYTGTQLAEPGLWAGQTDVFLRELDLASLQLVGPTHFIWHGALEGAVWAEGPHLYRRDDVYYLVASEGGTEREHAVSVARGARVTGPYEGSPANPVLTHRDLGDHASIRAVGHADLVEAPDGSWWSLVLATRVVDDVGSLLGRETNLVSIEWQRGWPVFAPGDGRVRPTAEGPFRTPAPAPARVTRDEFDEPVLGLDWNTLRTSDASPYSLGSRKSCLSLPLDRGSIDAVGVPAFVGRRVRHLLASARAVLDFAPTAGQRAGLVLRQSEDAHMALCLAERDGVRSIEATLRAGGVTSVLACAAVAEGPVELEIEIGRESSTLRFSFDGNDTVLATAPWRDLSSEAAGGFLGTWIGMFAQGDGAPSGAEAHFDWFEYRNLGD